MTKETLYLERFEPCLQSSRLIVAISMEDVPGGGGGYFLVKDYWGCAAGWGRIFTTGLTIMGSHF